MLKEISRQIKNSKDAVQIAHPTAERLRQLGLRNPSGIDQTTDSLSLLNRIQVDALQVLNKRRYLRIAITDRPQNSWPTKMPCGSPTTLTSNKHPTARHFGMSPNNDRLQLSLHLHRAREGLDSCLFNNLPRLVGIGIDSINIQFHRMSKPLFRGATKEGCGNRVHRLGNGAEHW